MCCEQGVGNSKKNIRASVVLVYSQDTGLTAHVSASCHVLVFHTTLSAYDKR